MRKFLLVTLIDGKTTHKIDLAGMARTLSLTAGKDQFLVAALETARCGFMDETLPKDRMVWIAPSQIKTVEVVFDNALKL